MVDELACMSNWSAGWASRLGWSTVSGHECSKMAATNGDDAGLENESLLRGRQPKEHGTSSMKGLVWKVLTSPLAFRRARIITVEPAVFLFGFAVFLTLPISQQFFYQYYAVYYLRQLNHSNLTASGMCIDPDLLQTPLHPEQKDSPSVEHYVKSDSSHFILYFTVLGTVLQSISILLIGPLTDIFGRKMGFITACAGAGMQYGVLLIVIYFELSLYITLIGAVVSGLTGGVGVILMAAFTYAADVSSHKTRTLRIGIATACFFVAGALSEYTGGIWLNRNDCTFEPILWCALACSFAAIVYTVIGFSESRRSDKQSHPPQSKTSKCYTCNVRCVITLLKTVVIKFLKGLQIFFRPRLETMELWLALVTESMYVLNSAGTQLIGVLFFKAYPLHWTPGMIGNFDSLNFALHGIVIFLSVPIVTVVLKLADSLIAFIGFIPPIMMYLLVAYYGEELVTWQMFLCKSQQPI